MFELNKKIWKIIIVILAAASVGSLIFVKTYRPQSPIQISMPDRYGKPQPAPQGQYAPKFPRQLILGDKLTLASSYETPYKQGYLAFANLKSGATVQDNYQKYLDYFVGQGYQIARKTLQADQASIYAKKANEEVLFTSYIANNKTYATVSYFGNNR